MAPNFILLDHANPEIARLMSAMLRAREAVGRRSWSHPMEPITEEWWRDVLADPRARRSRQRDSSARRTRHTLADEEHDFVLVACGKCDWRATFSRQELIASHGIDAPMPDLLRHMARPDCERLDSMWDRCGARRLSSVTGSTPDVHGLIQPFNSRSHIT